MIRPAAAMVLVGLCAVPARAQNVMFRVAGAPADVYKAPTTASPIIGQAPAGAALDVTRELGSWVKVVWPKAQDGFGYVHVSSGTIARASAETPDHASARASSIPPTPPRAQARTATTTATRSTDAAPAAQSYIRRPPHTFGVGGRAAAPDPAIGVAARAWSRSRNPFGLQIELSRSAIGDGPGHTTSVQFAPSVLYGFRDHVSDYWWLRPYVGAGPSLQHQSRGELLPGDGDLLSDTRLDFQAFGGAEVSFSSLPRLAVSADAGYRGQPTSFSGIEPHGFGVVISAHWYLR